MKRRSAMSSKWLTPVIWLAIVIVAYTLCKRSIILSDEGYILLQAHEIAAGKVLYRDLDAFVAPGIWLLMGGVFRIFPESVFVSRMVSLTCILATAAVIHAIVARVANRHYAQGALVAYGALSVWAFPAWHFIFYSAWSVLAALCALERFLWWRRRQGAYGLLVAGLCAGISLVFKQNYGALATAALGLAVVVETFNDPAPNKRSFRVGAGRASTIAAGVILAIAPVILYFWAHRALAAAMHSLVVRPFSEFASQHTLPFPPLHALFAGDFFSGPRRLIYEAVAVSVTPFVYVAPPAVQRLVQALHVVLYYGPISLFAGAVLLLLVRRAVARVDVELFACLAMAVLVFVGVFPRADFNHLINVYQPLIILGAVLVHRGTSAGLRYARSLPVLAVAICLPYLAVAVFWYGLVMDTMTSKLPMPRGGVLIDPLKAAMITHEVDKIRELTEPREPVLTIPSLSMLNFLAERPMPGNYANFFAAHIGHDAGRGVVDSMEHERVRWVVTENFDYFADTLKMREFAPELMGYLRRNFRLRFGIAIDRHWFLSRREHPLAIGQRVPLLPACDASSWVFGDRASESRLLFDVLSHRFRGPGASGTDLLETHCNFIVPEGGRLFFLLGYRQPSTASKDTTILAEVTVASWEDVRDERVVFSATIAVAPASDWSSPAPEEHYVSLRDYAEQNVVLTLKTSLNGKVDVNPLDAHGFAATWSDVSIETSRAAER